MARTYLGVWNTYWFETGGSSHDADFDERGRYKLYYEQDQAQGTTTIYVEHYMHKWSGSSRTDVFLGSVTSKATINGGQQTVARRDIFSDLRQGYNEILIGTTTHTIYHDAEGKAICQLRGSFTYNYPPTTLTKTCSNTWNLPDIPLASKVSVDLLEQELGEEITISIEPKEPTYIHVLKYKYGTSNEVQIATNVSTTYDWTPSIDMAQYVTDNNYGIATIYCYSYDGSVSDANYRGVSSTTIRLNMTNVPEPTCYLEVSDANTTTTNEPGKVPASWGTFIKGYSKLKLDATISYSYGATMRERTLINVDGEQSSSNPFISPNFVSTIGRNANNVYVTDSRGMQGTAGAVIDVQDYVTPSARLNVVRCDNNGNYDASGENAKVTINYAITDLTNDLGQSCNAKHYVLKYREKGAQSYTTLRDLDLTNYSGILELVITNVTFNIGTTYEFIVIVSDQFNPTEAEATLPYLKKPASYKGNKGVTFGRHAIDDGFNCYYDAKFYGLMDYGVIAYDNSNGDNGNITLDYDASNYNHCIILYRTNDTDEPVNSVRVDDPDGKNVMLMGVQPYTSTSRCYLKYKKVTISGTSITNVNYSEIEIRNNVSPALSNNNNIYILKVIFF